MKGAKMKLQVGKFSFKFGDLLLAYPLTEAIYLPVVLNN